MLHLYQSNRLERLAEALAALLLREPLSPLCRETVVVPHPGVGRWLGLRLAERLGICANVEFPLPAAFIWRVLREFLGELPEANRFEPGVLTWGILRGLHELRDDPRFGPVRRYLRDGDPIKGYELAGRLALLFDRYLVYRPDWIAAWEGGRSATPGDDWQAALWRYLVGSQGTEADSHWVRLLEHFFARSQGAEVRPNGLPRRIALFGVPSLSPGYLQVLGRLSHFMEIHLFLLNPCQAYWTEITDPREKERRELAADGGELYLEVGNPLLASLGRQGRDFFAALLEFDAGQTEERFEPADDDTLLGRLQNDILDLRDPADEPPRPLPAGDLSLQIHACHSPLREAEALYDRLLELFERFPDLRPADVLVMTPEMDSYAPALEAVFAEPGDRPAIPFRLSDRPLVAESPLVGAFFQLLEIPHSRYELPRLAALLEIPAVARRFDLSEDEVARALRWLDEAGVRWGRDAAFRARRGLPPLAQNSWRFGLDRLLLGYALPGGEERLFAGILPYDEVEGAAAAALGSVAAAQRTGHPLHGLRRGRRIEGRGVRQHHRVHLGMRQVEAAAQHMAQLVVQRHAHLTQHRTAQPGSVQRIAARGTVTGPLAQHRQRPPQLGQPPVADQVNHAHPSPPIGPSASKHSGIAFASAAKASGGPHLHSPSLGSMVCHS